MKKLGRVLLAGLVAGALVTSVQAVEYWTGGVGVESRAEAPMQNTTIEFFNVEGSYLAEIWFTLHNDRGELLTEGLTDGPWVVAQLPDGNYRISGERLENGEVQTAFFRVSGNRHQIVGLKYQSE